ncbi:unnamed protein product, partial [Iphiclides podalirius]
MSTFSFGAPISTAEDVEQAARKITCKIQEELRAATKAVPQVHRKDTLPRRLLDRLHEKRELRKLWARTRCPRVKTKLNRLKDELSAAIKAYRGEGWERRIEQASESQTSLHHLNRQLSRTSQPICPLVGSDGRKHAAAQDRADILAEHLEGQFVANTSAPGAIAFHQEVERHIQVFLSEPVPRLDGGLFITPAEVRRAASHLALRKAPGTDGITTLAIRQLPKRGLVTLCRLYNGVLRTAHFPSEWKTGKIIVLPKPGKDRRLPESYRPITLLPHVAKLFERLLLRRIVPCIELRRGQFGFRSGHSTTAQLARVLHYLAAQYNRGRICLGVLLDMEKAFDRVWHEGLLHKLLENTTTHRALVRLVASFLRDRKFVVHVEGADSAVRCIKAGVPQGSCLSPHLYAVYTDDIPTLEQNASDWDEDVLLALYADDSAFFTSSHNAAFAARKMQRQLDLLPEWLDRWRMSVNVDKTSAIFIRHIKHQPTLELRGQAITNQDTIRYLGCRIDRSLSMAPQVEHSVRQARAARAVLYPILASKLPVKTGRL